MVPGPTLAGTQPLCVGEETQAKCYRSLCKASFLHGAGSFPSLPLHFACSTPTTFLCKQSDSANTGRRWEEPGSFKCVQPQLMLLQRTFSEAMPLSAILRLYLISSQSKAFF